MRNNNIISLKIIAVFALLFMNISAAKTPILSDEQVKKAII